MYIYTFIASGVVKTTQLLILSAQTALTTIKHVHVLYLSRGYID